MKEVKFIFFAQNFQIWVGYQNAYALWVGK